MLMDDGAIGRLAKRGAAVGLAVILACAVGGCSRSAGGSFGGLLGKLRKNPDTGISYVKYSNRGDRGVFGRPKMPRVSPMRVKKY